MTNQLEVTPGMAIAINDAQHQILTQATPTSEIRTRQGKGGRYFPYTDPAYVIRTLNLAFGWDWDFEADNEDIFYANEKPFEAKVRGRLTVRNGDKVIVKVQYGCQPIEYQKNNPDMPVSLGDAYKGAASDALKKCASLLGVALDLYDSDSDINTGRTSDQPQKPKAPVTVETPPAPASQSAKVGNGNKQIDPYTRYWSEVKVAGLTREKGLEILAQAGNDASRGVDILLGLAQAA